MSKLRLAALTGVFLCGAVQAETYQPVADWLKLPAGRDTLGQMHGDIAVSRAGDVYVSIETAGMGRVGYRFIFGRPGIGYRFIFARVRSICGKTSL